MENTTQESIIDEDEEAEEEAEEEEKEDLPSVETDEYEVKFPLPDHEDPSLCRDEFIKTIVAAHEERISSLKGRITLPTRRSRSVLEDQLHWDPTGETPETMAVIAAVLKWHLFHGKDRVSVARSEAISRRLSVLKELNRQCQKAAIEFLSVRLLKQLRLFSSPWPGKLDEIPYHLFSWSLDHFMARLELNQMYLDVINRERSSEDLDCLKFRTDLHEIELMIHEIREDFRDDNDICTGSLQLLKEASYNLKGPWIKGVEENRLIKTKLRAYILLDTSSSVNLKNTRLTELLDQFEDVTALDPIELRYRINWLSSCADQKLIRFNQREEDLVKQLADLEATIQQDNMVHRNSETIYAFEVDSLRRELNEWQARYDNDLENAEVDCTVARLALQKVKDDHKFYKEQEVMMKRRIAEERAQMAIEEKIRREKQAKDERATLDVAAMVKEIEAVFKPKEPGKKKKKKPAKF